jgi:radical SAM protein with 4Fe4S-binding SPASM domain
MGKEYFIPEYPQKISFGSIEGYCNLRCNKCYAFGPKNKKKDFYKGEMPLEKALSLFDELKGTDAVVASPGYAESLMQKDFCDYLKAMKERGLRVNINTNGLLVTAAYAKSFIDLEIDGIFVSIDAATADTLKKVRGTDELEKIKTGVFALLDARNSKLFPRIGVSFVVEEGNAHEREEFVDFWLQHVDTVRVAELFSHNVNVQDQVKSENRKPCQMLYDSMLIHYNGDVPVCCWEPSGKTYLGNVFKDGIKGVWEGEKFKRVRYYHETDQFDKVPFCKECNDWARYVVPEETTDGNILIRRSPLLVYYNRIDRLATWEFGQGQAVKGLMR